jgi:hypothetical protein
MMKQLGRLILVCSSQLLPAGYKFNTQDEYAVFTSGIVLSYNNSEENIILLHMILNNTVYI